MPALHPDSAEVTRFDRAPVARAARTDEGYLVAPANLARVGVLEYLNADGTVRRELRLPSDVFAAESLATYQGKPIVRGHPYDLRDGLLDAHTAKGRIVGSVREVARADDGRHVTGVATVYDAETIRAIEAGEREISVGYRARLEPVPGGRVRLDDGTEVQADFIQRGIRANHIAIVRRGRAGESASIRLDSAGHQITGREPEEQTMTPEQIAAMQAELGRLKAELETTTKARTDGLSALEAERAARAKAEAEAATIKARLDSIETERQAAAHKALCARVAPIANEKAEDLVRLDAAEVQRRALAKLTPHLDLTGKDTTFVGAAFETAMAIAAPRLDSAQQIAGAVLQAPARGNATVDIQKAREEARKRAADASKRS